MSLRDEILASGLPLDDHGAIAAALSVGRAKITSRMIGVGTILAVFGGVGGQFLDALQAAGESNRDLHWLLQSNIMRGEFDVGDRASRAGMQALAAAMPPFAAGINALLALAEVPDPVSSQEVTRALEGL
jgi:hypothetical protein